MMTKLLKRFCTTNPHPAPKPVKPDYNTIYYNALYAKGFRDTEAADKVVKEAADKYNQELAAWEQENK